MKVLVIGATGFLGTYIVKELLQAGYTVHAFGRNRTIGHQLTQTGAQFICGDFVRYTDIEQACRDMDYVIHAGALSTIWGPWHDFYQTNVVGTEHVLQACQQHHIKRLVYISSPSIYAAPRHQLQIKEHEAPPSNSVNNYIKSKLLSEQKVAAYPLVPTVILRPRGLFGIGDTSVLPRVLKMSQTRGIPLVDGGQQWVDMTCVENVALASRLAMEQPNVAGHVYNITNGEPYLFKDLVELALNAMELPKKYRSINGNMLHALAQIIEGSYKLLHLKKEPPLTVYTYYLMRYSQTLDISKAVQELGYTPKISIKEGIERYAQHYLSH